MASRFDVLATALADAEFTLNAFARTLAALLPEILAAEERADELRRRMFIEGALGAAALVKDALGHGLTELAHERAAAERRVHELVEECCRADRICAADLSTAAYRIRALVDSRAPYAGWVSSAVPSGATAVLRRLGLLRTDDDARIVSWARGLGDDEAGVRALRAGLAGRPAAELAALLETCPDLAARLLHGTPPALAGALSLTGSARIEAVRHAFAALSPEQARQTALLYPAVVGSLDGAPFTARILANRVLISVALAQRQQELLQLRARREVLSHDWIPFNGDDLDGTIEGVDKRIAFYTDLLEEPTPDFGRRPGEPETLPGHQVLLFSDAGDGAFAELWGRVDDSTRNIGVLVPGTGTDMTNIGGFSARRVRSFAAEGSGSNLAMIAWMGGDLPDSVARDAPFRGYAEDLGPRLRDFTAGIDVPPDARVTVAGHSYGGAVVGVAERTGLVADRILHIESAGAGHGVRDVGDYPNQDADRYSMTAPGDFIGSVQGVEVGSLGHGADPDGLTGIVRLETGREVDSDPHSSLVEGFGAHSGVFDRETTAWENMYQVFTGGRVQMYVAPTTHVYVAFPQPIVVTDYPMSDPTYIPPRLDIE
jgi:hypothetical protein